MKCEECGTSEDVKRMGKGCICSKCYKLIMKNLDDAGNRLTLTLEKISKTDPDFASDLAIIIRRTVYESGFILDEKGVPMNLCELCDNFEGGKKREDNIYVCDE